MDTKKDTSYQKNNLKQHYLKMRCFRFFVLYDRVIVRPCFQGLPCCSAIRGTYAAEAHRSPCCGRDVQSGRTHV